MNWKEAVQAMIEGKKVRSELWGEDCYIWFRDKSDALWTDELSNDYLVEKEAMVREWEIYEEPKLKLGSQHVGRKVKQRNGAVSLIIAYFPDSTWAIRTGSDSFNVDGKGRTDGTESPFDIIELLE